ncbi:hypothetical protein [Algirhabdus cladophorae]|uniref:hypothetical protein n=1 Tax=Algirhabdus cladophorae TaxID=3377108 RepID=UPI003B84B4A6
MPQIIALWCVPGVQASGITRIMQNAQHYSCHETPFAEAWYQGESPLWPAYEKSDPTTPGLSLDSVLTALDAQARHRDLFVWDSPHFLSTFWNNETVSLFTHCFLICEPGAALQAADGHRVTTADVEDAFDQQRRLFDHVSDVTHDIPLVIDCAALAKDPKGMAKVWTTAIGLRDVPLTFHGLASQPNPVDLNALSDAAKNVYLRTRPHYDHLAQYQLKA